MNARTILSKFPKEVIIAFVIERSWLHLGKNARALEADLLYIQWSQETDAAMKVCDDALKEMSKHGLFTKERAAADAMWKRGDDRYKRAERLYARMEKLREKRN